MSRISDEKILKHLSDSIEQLTPDCAKELWEQPIAPADDSDWFLDHSDGKTSAKRKRRYFIGAAAACLCLCFLSAVLFQTMPSAAVCLDVNPCVMLNVNYRDRVTNVTAYNQDAEVIIGDMDLRGSDLDVAIYAILGSMVHHGYLTENTDTVLMSVYSPNACRADELEAEVSDLVSASLEKMIQAGEVLSQKIITDKIDTSQKENDVTPGKIAFVEELIEKHPQLDGETMEEMSMDEIITLLEEENLDYSEYIDHRNNETEDDDEEDDENDKDDDEESEEEDDEDDENDDDDEEDDDVDDEE